MMHEVVFVSWVLCFSMAEGGYAKMQHIENVADVAV